MDYTIKNISQLQEGLARMKGTPELPTPSTSRSSTPIAPNFTNNDYHYESRQEPPITEYFTPPSNPRIQTSTDRTSSSQMSTGGLLMNIAALQTSTNNKLEKLTDAIIRLHRAVDITHKEQVKQTELLTTIVRNTANMQITIAESSTQGSVSKGKSGSIKDYGFKTAKQLFAEFLLKLLDQIKIQIVMKGKSYKSTRDMDLKLTTQLIKAAMDNQFKINGVLHSKLDANSMTHPSLVKVANSIGSIEGTNPTLTPEAFREIVEDVKSNYFVSNFQTILERIRIIKVLIPFYESDIICAMEFPYFNKNGEAICNWHKILPRDETMIEAKVATVSATERNKLAELLAKGISERAALNAALGNI